MADGQHTVSASIANTAGNVLSDTWSFTVMQPPQITDIYPAHQSEQAGVDRVSAVISDNGTINWSSVKLTINGSSVPSAQIVINQALGTVTHLRNFATGNYTVTLEVKDTHNNTAARTWVFLTDTTPPALTSLSHFSEGMVITGGILRFSARLDEETMA